MLVPIGKFKENAQQPLKYVVPVANMGCSTRFFILYLKFRVDFSCVDAAVLLQRQVDIFGRGARHITPKFSFLCSFFTFTLRIRKKDRFTVDILDPQQVACP